jgi:hypothetical protein
MTTKTTAVCATGFVLFMALGPGAAPVAAQARDAPAIRFSAFAGASLREAVTGPRFAEDVLSGSFRVTYLRPQLRPWIQVERFVRPELECQPPLTCSEEGWTALAGVTATSGRRDTRPGLHVHLMAGIGWAFAEEERLVYALGVGAAYPLTPWLAPSLEFRWEDLPGIRNVFMINAGIRLDVF